MAAVIIMIHVVAVLIGGSPRHSDGYEAGCNAGYDMESNNGRYHTEAYRHGYPDGFDDCEDKWNTVNIIPNLIAGCLAVVTVPSCTGHYAPGGGKAVDRRDHIGQSRNRKDMDAACTERRRVYPNNKQAVSDAVPSGSSV